MCGYKTLLLPHPNSYPRGFREPISNTAVRISGAAGGGTSAMWYCTLTFQQQQSINFTLFGLARSRFKATFNGVVVKFDPC